ncbi:MULTISPECIES: type VI secretion system baseplate subunit TssG [unclassified Herbaspirillum]|uniref:type VI secretion system baseplate subunit TssG n=1 Tax=unclassified Herbaspirillum TaxID=2624150 RepID=UPI00161B8EA8|nr:MULTISPECIES: type VI secretion system baseplate subunit TssG [unclassified Herbaspirillum]
MNFFRFCELLELASPDASPLGTSDSPVNEPVRFRSRKRLGFPHREIDAVEHDADVEGARPTIRTSFLGLYGVDACMPSYFVNEIAQNREGADSLGAFLDVFHHRIITQFYRVWRKYRYPVGFRSNGRDKISGYLLSFAGLGIGDMAVTREHVGNRKLLSMLGLAAQKTRTAEGLAGILQHALPDVHIEVHEFHPTWIRLTDFARTPLGENCVLGRGFHDRANTIRIVLRPQSQESLLALIPGQAQYSEVLVLLQFYLGYEVQAHLHMEVSSTWMPKPVLQSPDVRLGYSSRLADRTLKDQQDRIVQVRLGSYDGSAATQSRPTTTTKVRG